MGVLNIGTQVFLVSYTDIDGLARDLLKWTWSNPSPANLVLITNEPIFYETENTISRMGYNVNRYFFSRCLWSSVRGAVLSWKQWMVREQDSGVCSLTLIVAKPKVKLFLN